MVINEGVMDVSVCMITYKHEEYIARAIEGVLAQEFNGRVELVIRDDASPDSTRETCKQYQARYPDKIRLLPLQPNIGMMPNFIRAMDECKGKYIALCEGDDYWTDPLKLQKQVDLLESNPDWVASTHNVFFVDERNRGKEPQLFSAKASQCLAIEDVAPTRGYHTASMVIRASVYHDVCLPWLRKGYRSGDKVMALTLLMAGKVYYSSEPMAVYRRHADGASTSPNLDQFMQSDVKFYTDFAKALQGADKRYVEQCALYYRVAALQYQIKNKPHMGLLFTYVGLLPWANRSQFLPWTKYKFMGKELYWKAKAKAKAALLGRKNAS